MAATDWTLGVLLGGASQRMGQDKVFLKVQGVTLLEYVLNRCQGSESETILSIGRSGRTVPAPLEKLIQVPDREPKGGPLFGIEAILNETRTTWLVVIPCDMPGMHHDVLVELLHEAQQSDSACYTADSEQKVMPMVLRTAWARSVLPRILDSGRRRIVALLDDGRHVRVPWSGPGDAQEAFHNINTQSEFQTFFDSGTGPGKTL